MTKPNQNKTKSGGRPLSYDPTLVHEIISAGLSAGAPAEDLDADFVKTKLCNEHDVKGTIRQEALESLVSAAHAEIEEARNEALLKALPDGIMEAVATAVTAAQQELMLVVARQHKASDAMADEKCQELRADKRNAQHRVAELEGALAEEKATLKALAEVRDDVTAELADCRKQLREAQAEVERLSREPSGVDRLIAELRDPAIREDIRAALSEILANPTPIPAE